MKRILAIEWSTRRLSCALSGHEEVSEKAPRFHAPTAIGLLDRMLTDSGMDWQEIEEIRVGKGPGNYSGVRQAFAWAFGVTAPGGMKVRSVSSGQAQAYRLQQGTDEPFWILGDARRGSWWGGLAGSAMDWGIASPDEWQERVADGRVYSAEAERLTGLAQVVQNEPRASDLLTVPEDFMGSDNRPLYLHPAVSTN